MFERDYHGNVSDIHPAVVTLTVIAIVGGIIFPLVLIGKWLLLNIDGATAGKCAIGIAWAWFGYVGWGLYRSKRRWKIQQVKDRMNEAK